MLNFEKYPCDNDKNLLEKIVDELKQEGLLSQSEAAAMIKLIAAQENTAQTSERNAIAS